MRVRVDWGEARILTGPAFAGRRLVVETGEGVTEITGTAFSVVRNHELTCVCVLEGEARVGPGPGGMDPIPAGMRKVMFHEDRPALVAPIEPVHERHLIAFVASYRAQLP
jgi:ferric-dicitrate binding protein FerR (iron transport regulator)